MRTLNKNLKSCPGTRSLLQHLPVQSPVEQLVIMEPEKESAKTSGNWWSTLNFALLPQSSFGRTGFAMATFVFLFFMMGAFTNMNFSVGDGGVNLTFGEVAPVQTGYTAAQVEMIINQVQQEKRTVNQRICSCCTRATRSTISANPFNFCTIFLTIKESLI